MSLTERKIRTISCYQGVIVNTRLDTAELPNGTMALREVVEHPGGVTVIPVEDDGTVWCVRQFRYPFAQELLEVPAGKLERGEQPLDCAVRELSEETGLTADEMIYMGPHYSSPGYLQEVLHIYLARGLHPGKAHLDEGEFLNVEKHALDELVSLALAGQLPDSKTNIAVLKAKLLLGNG